MDKIQGRPTVSNKIKCQAQMEFEQAQKQRT